MLRKIAALAIAFSLLTAGFMAGSFGFDAANASEPATIFQQTDLQTQNLLNERDQLFSTIYDHVSPSVVAINVTRQSSSSLDTLTSSGSGFVIDTSGHIVTNFHVVRQSTELVVNFFDGTITRAEIIGLDADSDLAVIQVDLPEDRLFPVEFGDVDDLIVGQTVLAIGSPFGQRWTLTSGIVSALERSIEGLNNYSIGSAIQTDTPINPGNSGGPLLNLNGQVIGVTSQILSETRSNSGIGFAIPSNLVQRVAEELIQTGNVEYSFIGIGGDDVTLQVIEALRLANNQRGMVVSGVLPNGPAEAAGILNAQGIPGDPSRLGSADIIVQINDQPITGLASLVGYLAKETRPGDVVDITVLRNGELITLPVTLAIRPG
jgi:2-alkenal reductase